MRKKNKRSENVDIEKAREGVTEKVFMKRKMDIRNKRKIEMEVYLYVCECKRGTENGRVMI